MAHDPAQLIAQIEALLFIYGEPIDVKKLAKNLDASEDDIRKGLAALERELARTERGLILVEDKGKVQLVTKPAFSQLLETITKQEFSESLTPATLETLSIISYAGPISRADIEYIRGVNSSFIVRTLLMRGLVERATDPKRANSYLYSTSFELLRHLGLSKNIDLPEYTKYHDLVLHMHDELQQKDAAQQAIDLPPADATIPAEPLSSSDAPDPDTASEQPQS